MRRLLWIPIVCVFLLVPVVVLAGSGGGGFDSVVSSIESRYHVHAARIPFAGFFSLASFTATHGGVGGMHVAEIEHFTAPVDGEELNRMVAQKLGDGWERVIRETSRKGREQSLIFMRPEGRRMGMFVLDLDGDEIDVVELSVDPEHLSQSVGQYDHGRSGGGAGGSD